MPFVRGSLAVIALGEGALPADAAAGLSALG
jgi:hypothetical protein